MPNLIVSQHTGLFSPDKDWLPFYPIESSEKKAEPVFPLFPQRGSYDWLTFTVRNSKEDLKILQLWQEKGVSSSRISPNTLAWGIAINLYYPKQVTIESLNDNTLFVKKPFRVELSIVDNEFIGEIKELKLYSFGENEDEVIRELQEEIEELFKDLSRKQPQNLGKLPTEWLRILNQHIAQ